MITNFIFGVLVENSKTTANHVVNKISRNELLSTVESGAFKYIVEYFVLFASEDKEEIGYKAIESLSHFIDNKIVGSKVKTMQETKDLLADTFKNNETALSVATNFFMWRETGDVDFLSKARESISRF